MTGILPEDIRAALGRILNDKPHAGDGRLFRIWVRNRLMQTLNGAIDSSALLVFEGERRLLSELNTIALGQNDRTTDTDYRDDAELRRGSQLPRTSGANGSARRVAS
jgi:hypothetical protein